MSERKAGAIDDRDDIYRRSRPGRGWFRDPAVWAWVAVGALALLPLGSALAQLLR